MPNSIDYAEKYQSFIDEELVHRSYTEFMAPNEAQIEYSGGKDIKVAQIDVTGLGNYDRNAAGSHYPDGSVTVRWNTYSMQMDRAVRFELGRLDPSDSGFIASTENVTREFARKKLIPEQDTYRFNRVYNALKAKTELSSHIKTLAADLTPETAVSAVTDLFTLVKEASDDEQDFVAFMAMKNEAVFRAAAKNNHHDIQFGKAVTVNGCRYKCMLVNELPVVLVPSKRLQTLIKVQDARSEGQKEGGIVADAASEQIELLLLSAGTAMAVGKIDSLKVIDANDSETGDETLILYHFLYDCWVLDNQLSTVGALVREKTA